MYLPPNEQYPAVALPIWRQSNHEAYVSVGTERSFMGAAVARAEALVVVDYDPEVIQFAAINRALLAASHSREDYIVLRLTATAEIWAQRAAEVGHEDGRTLLDQSSWSFWKKSVRENTKAWSGAFEHFNRPANKVDGPFAQTNYMFADQLYEHLRTLAKRGCIWTRLLDHRDEKMLTKVCDEMYTSGLKLGVVDTSNVPGEWEGGAAAAGKYVSWFSRWAVANTLFLSTEPANQQSASHWSYFAFTGKAVRGRSAERIQRWYEEEIAKLRADPRTLALVDDPDVVAKGEHVATTRNPGH